VAPPTGQHSLRLNGVSKELGGRTVVADLDLQVGAGELVCLLGASGCGKTTTLRMIGGFLTPDSGTIEIDGIDYTNVPANGRPTAMVFQNYALWPHMTVFDNIAFGLKIRKLSRSEIAERVESVLTTVGLLHHIRSRPGQISGGEQQRVALARSLVLEPSVLLLDEPLSNLDAKLRVRVREEIREIQHRTGITMVFVTHDQEEALSLADRIAVMNEGRVEQYAPPDTVYRTPATSFVARFVGSMNFFPGLVLTDAADAEVVLRGGARVPAAEINGPASGEGDGPVSGETTVGVRPEDIRLSSDGSGIPGTVLRDIPLGHYREVTVSVGDVELKVFADANSTWEGTVGVSFTRATVFADGEVPLG
jgi:ABC-type Fe3+/spermidine/putrescine transport system ATPase subunit